MPLSSTTYRKFSGTQMFSASEKTTMEQFDGDHLTVALSVQGNCPTLMHIPAGVYETGTSLKPKESHTKYIYPLRQRLWHAMLCGRGIHTGG